MHYEYYTDTEDMCCTMEIYLDEERKSIRFLLDDDENSIDFEMKFSTAVRASKRLKYLISQLKDIDHV